VPPEPGDGPVAVPRLQRALLGRAAVDGRLGSRLSPLALPRAGGGQAPLPADLPLRHLVPELGARPDVGGGEPVAATPGAHAVTRSRAGGVAVRHAARVERYPGAGRPHPGVDRPVAHRGTAGPQAESGRPAVPLRALAPGNATSAAVVRRRPPP